MIWFYPDNIESGGKCWLRNIKIPNSPSEWHEFFLCFCIFDRPGLNFKAIKLKFSQMVDLIEGYNLCKNSSQLLLRFAILKFATGSSEWDDITEIVCFRHIRMQKGLHLRNRTHKTKRKTGNMVYKYFSVISYHSERLLRISILRKHPFSCDFNIVWIKPYHSTRVRLPVFC